LKFGKRHFLAQFRSLPRAARKYPLIQEIVHPAETWIRPKSAK